MFAPVTLEGDGSVVIMGASERSPTVPPGGSPPAGPGSGWGRGRLATISSSKPGAGKGAAAQWSSKEAGCTLGLGPRAAGGGTFWTIVGGEAVGIAVGRALRADSAGEAGVGAEGLAIVACAAGGGEAA